MLVIIPVPVPVPVPLSLPLPLARACDILPAGSIRAPSRVRGPVDALVSHLTSASPLVRNGSAASVHVQTYSISTPRCGHSHPVLACLSRKLRVLIEGQCQTLRQLLDEPTSAAFVPAAPRRIYWPEILPQLQCELLGWRCAPKVGWVEGSWLGAARGCSGCYTLPSSPLLMVPFSCASVATLR